MADTMGDPPPPRPGATLAQVALRVGVSLNTVSRSLRAPHTVRPELKRRIDAVMDEVGYVPNRLAGSLAGTRADLVGVVVTSLFHSEFAAVVEGLQEGLGQLDLQVMLGNSHYDPEQEWRIVRSMLSWRPAAVAIVGMDHHPRATALLAASGVPVVEMWDVGGTAIDSAAGMDHDAIGRIQAEHLVTRGCRLVGRRVPDDVRVIGFGDHEAADCVAPALTSIRPPRRGIGRAAAEIVLARLAGEAPRRVALEPALIARDSTGPQS